MGSRGCFRIGYRLRFRLPVRDGRRLRGGGSTVLRGLGFGGNRLLAIVPVVAAQLEYHVVFEGAGVRLFVRDAQLGELLQYFVSFDFQLPRQLVNSDLSHR
jgi:hypothetical protein